MFHVITVNLAPDTTSADVAHAATDLGELSPEEFTALLERFRHLDPVQNLEGDPHLLVTARAGKFLIRTGQGKLLLYNSREPLAPYAELSASQIVGQLDQAAHLGPAPAAEPGAKSAVSAPNRGIAFAILLAGLALNGYTLYSVFYTASVDQKPVITLVTDVKELAAHQHEVVGTYTTGDQPGDRAITVTASGTVTFAEIGAKGGFGSNTDTYRLGRHASRYCLATADSGVVDIANIDTLVYYRDIYKRTK